MLSSFFLQLYSSRTKVGKAMAPHSSVLAWRIPGVGEPGKLLSMGSHRVRHDCSNVAAAAAGLEWTGRDGDGVRPALVVASLLSEIKSYLWDRRREVTDLTQVLKALVWPLHWNRLMVEKVEKQKPCRWLLLYSRLSDSVWWWERNLGWLRV